MAAIMCELCGSNDVVKQGEYFVCQHCGTKYTVEDAKKLIGTVKIDKTGEIQNYLQLARNARAKQDWEDSIKYYSLVEADNPNNREAMFYSVYGKARAALSVNDKFKRGDIFEALWNTLIMVFNKSPICTTFLDFAENEAAFFLMLCDDCADLTSSGFVYTQNYSDGQKMGNDAYYTYNLFMNVNLIFSNCCKIDMEAVSQSAGIAEEDKIKYADFFFPLALKHLTMRMNTPSTHPRLIQARKETVDYIAEIHEAWHRINANHEVPDTQMLKNRIISETEAEIKKENGCYVATAVYGSYDCPQVWTLRRYRDYTLAETWLGRLFILLYYAISPTLVKWFGETQWFKNMWKPRLDKMVKRLNEQGVADTPYQDRQW